MARALRAAWAAAAILTLAILTLALLTLALACNPASAQSAAFTVQPNTGLSNPQLQVEPLFTHMRTAPLRITATVESYCAFQGNAGNSITMSCSFNTPMAASFIGNGVTNSLPSATFAMSSAGILSQQNVNPFCGFSLILPPDAQATPDDGIDNSQDPRQFFSTFEVCF